MRHLSVSPFSFHTSFSNHVSFFIFSLLNFFPLVFSSSPSSTLVKLQHLSNSKGHLKEKFLGKCIVRDMDLIVILSWVLKIQCKAEVRLADIRPDKASCSERCEMRFGQFLFLLVDGLQVKLKEIGTPHVQ